mgnify:CR=1 FL=1
MTKIRDTAILYIYLSTHNRGILYEDTIIRTFHLQKIAALRPSFHRHDDLTSIYGVVDGLFVSNYVGKTAFAAVNLIMPFLMAISALGFMIGTGGSAIVAKTLGEGKKEQANEYFSMLVYLTLIGGIVLSALGILFSPLIARGLGADGALLTNCVLYARITLLSMPAFMLQNVFQSFFVTAENQNLVLVSSSSRVSPIWFWTFYW